MASGYDRNGLYVRRTVDDDFDAVTEDGIKRRKRKEIDKPFVKPPDIDVSFQVKAMGYIQPMKFDKRNAKSFKFPQPFKLESIKDLNVARQDIELEDLKR